MSKKLFRFAAKAGSLEGYLYMRDKLDDLDNWVNNIVAMYHEFSPAGQAEMKDELRVVLNRCLTYGEETLKPGLRKKLQAMLKELD